MTISGIANVGGTTSITYNVTLFDPNVLGQSVAISGPGTPPSSGATYTFNGIDQADAYDLQVATGSTAAWTEGAENSPAPQITTETTGTYTVIQSAVRRTGVNAFHLAFPDDGGSNPPPSDFADQSFQVTRQIIPASSSNLQFYDLGRFAATATTLSAQVSNDNGSTWTQVWTRPGVGLSSSNWDASFVANNISLSAYAGQVILVRFVLSCNGQPATLGTGSTFGFFIDDVTITNATQLTNITDTNLAGSATSFSLNSSSAGGSLQAGATYYLRVRPEVGLKWYGFGNYKLATPTAASITSYSNWVASAYPAVTEGPIGDHSGDGIPQRAQVRFRARPDRAQPARRRAGSADYWPQPRAQLRRLGRRSDVQCDDLDRSGPLERCCGYRYKW